MFAGIGAASVCLSVAFSSAATSDVRFSTAIDEASASATSCPGLWRWFRLWHVSVENDTGEGNWTIVLQFLERGKNKVDVYMRAWSASSGCGGVEACGNMWPWSQGR